MKSILVTGGAGFIGSNFVTHILHQHKDYQIINLDALTYAGDLSNLKEVDANPHHIFIKGDILDRSLIERIFNQYNILGLCILQLSHTWIIP